MNFRVLSSKLDKLTWEVHDRRTLHVTVPAMASCLSRGPSHCSGIEEVTPAMIPCLSNGPSQSSRIIYKQ